MSQLLLTVFLGPVGRFHGFEFAVLPMARLSCSVKLIAVAVISDHVIQRCNTLRPGPAWGISQLAKVVYIYF